MDKNYILELITDEIEDRGITASECGDPDMEKSIKLEINELWNIKQIVELDGMLNMTQVEWLCYLVYQEREMNYEI